THRSPLTRLGPGPGLGLVPAEDDVGDAPVHAGLTLDVAGQTDAEGAALVAALHQLDRPAQELGDLAADVEAQTRSPLFAGVVVRDLPEGAEELGLVFRRDAGPAVADGDL